MSPTTAGILSTGSEILEGLYADTNAQWLSQQLTSMGLRVRRHVAAPDRAEDVADALAYLVGQCDVVIMSGGLGPTEDDLTRQAVSRVFGVGLTEDKRAWQMIEKRFVHRGTKPPESNRVQCMIPDGARVLYNQWGTAPGFVIEGRKALAVADRDVWFAALPGPPREMRPMFEHYLVDEFRERFGGGLATRITTIHTFGISESALNEMLRDMFDAMRGHDREALALLAGEARVDVRLVVRGDDPKSVSKRTAALSQKVRRRIPVDCIYGRNDETLESVVGRLMRSKGLTLAIAESCTGGLVAKRLTDIAGSSEFLKECCVTYSNDAKRARLGVNEATLKAHGAVSEETAREMARGMLESSGADVAVSVTGVAGPGGGTPEKPVGTVWYGLAWHPKRVSGKGRGIAVATARTGFRSGRDLVRAFASHRALDLVRRCVEGLDLDIPSFRQVSEPTPQRSRRTG